MAKQTTYKARVKNMVYADGTEVAQIKFKSPIRYWVGDDFVDVSIDGDGILIKPSPKGRFKATERLTVYEATAVMNLRALNGEYHRIEKVDGGYRLPAIDRTGFTNEYKMKKNKPAEEAVTRPAAKKSPYKNPYLGTVTKSSTLKGIVNEQCEKIEQLNKDIEEAEKLLKELTEERDRLMDIQAKAGELIRLLGGA